MNAGQKSVRRIASSNGVSHVTVCFSCRYRLTLHTSQRQASAAAAAATVEEAQHVQANSSNPPVTAQGPRKAFELKCSPVLSRPPLLTRDLTSFEKAFYLYQKRLNERQALPFTQYFYFKKATPAVVEWKRKREARGGTAAKDIGKYNAYKDDSWNDETLVGSTIGEREEIMTRLIRDAEGKGIEETPIAEDEASSKVTAEGGARRSIGGAAVEKPLPRITKADQENDRRSLSRKLDRSLYLLVKTKHGNWRFPEDRLYGRENLHQAAERILIQTGGINMNTWVVGNHPVGHYIYNFPRAVHTKMSPNRLVASPLEEELEEYGKKVFFMKSRIMAGQADVSKNEYGDQEYLWLAKEEVQEKVDQYYWSWVKNMLTER